MKKLLQFLSIGILSSSVATSVTACNNNEQKNNNLNKKDEQQKQIKEVKNKEFESKEELNKEIKEKFQEPKKETNSKSDQVAPAPVPRKRLKRELGPIPAPRNKKEAVNLENKEQDLVINKEAEKLVIQIPNKESDSTLENQEILNEVEQQQENKNLIIEEDKNLVIQTPDKETDSTLENQQQENFEDFDLVDEYIEDSQEELLPVRKEQENRLDVNFEEENLAIQTPDKEADSTLENQEQEIIVEDQNATKKFQEIIEGFDFIDEYIDDSQDQLMPVRKEQQKELTIEEIINNMKELNDKLEREYQALLIQQELDSDEKQDSNQQESIEQEPIKKDSELILRTDKSIEDVNTWKQKLDKKIRSIKTLSDNLENREKELLNFQEQFNQKQKTIEKLENNFSEISKEIKTFEKKSKRRVGFIIDEVYHDAKPQEIQVDIDLNKDEKIIESAREQEILTNKPSLSKEALKKNLEKINKIFKLKLMQNRFYIKGGKDVSHIEKEQMLADVFLPIFSKLPHHDNYKYKINLVTTDNSETQHIQYIIETKLKKSGLNKPFEFRSGYAKINVDWVTVNKNKILIKEFKNKLEKKLLKTEFKISQEQTEKAASFIKEQTDRITNKLNKEKKYCFTLEDVHLFIFKNQEFQLNLKISKPLPNSLANLTKESVSIKLPYKIIINN